MEKTTICVTGGTGFVGQEVVSRLLMNGYLVHALVRNEHSAKKLAASKEKFPAELVFFYGDATEPGDIAKALEGCSALIHLVGTRREEIKQTGLSYADIDLASAIASSMAMQRTATKRILLLSAGAIGNSEYVRTKAAAEKAIIDARLDWTIFRPSFIIGPGQQWPVVIGPFLWLLGLFPGKFGETVRRADNITREQLAHDFIAVLQNKKYIGKILEVPELKKM